MNADANRGTFVTENKRVHVARRVCQPAEARSYGYAQATRKLPRTSAAPCANGAENTVIS